ncbi:ATP-binding cassette domain-containing protein [Caenispirillum bisanense]|uniref:ATP-binding cassette domain-containing protein n=1 Tax=Caenispirillum bisanense TaxID=414052 RepID=UPI0031CE8A91
MPLDANTPAPLVIEGLRKSFGAYEVLKGIDLTAHTGDVISIIGSSGSGKSTFLRCINLLEMPDDGRVQVHGELIRMKRLKNGHQEPADKGQLRRIRARLSMMFQSFNLWSHLTILDNVALPPQKVLGKSRAEAVEAAEALLAKVGMFERRDHYPGQISGGQQQRAAIARALAMEPEVLLFDEPTSALDPELVGEVLKVMAGLAEEGRTMLVVTHEMAFAREVSSQVMFLHAGEVEEFGEPETVFANPRSERLRQFVSRSF